MLLLLVIFIIPRRICMMVNSVLGGHVSRRGVALLVADISLFLLRMMLLMVIIIPRRIIISRGIIISLGIIRISRRRRIMVNIRRIRRGILGFFRFFFTLGLIIRCSYTSARTKRKRILFRF